jgi:drug/metabolite transporter (DMT)-like permease
LTLELFFATILGKIILSRQFSVQHYLSLVLMIFGGLMLAWVPWSQQDQSDKNNRALGVFYMALSRGIW